MVDLDAEFFLRIVHRVAGKQGQIAAPIEQKRGSFDLVAMEIVQVFGEFGVVGDQVAGEVLPTGGKRLTRPEHFLHPLVDQVAPMHSQSVFVIILQAQGVFHKEAKRTARESLEGRGGKTPGLMPDGPNQGQGPRLEGGLRDNGFGTILGFHQGWYSIQPRAYFAFQRVAFQSLVPLAQTLPEAVLLAGLKGEDRFLLQTGDLEDFAPKRAWLEPLLAFLSRSGENHAAGGNQSLAKHELRFPFDATGFGWIEVILATGPWGEGILPHPCPKQDVKIASTQRFW